MTKILVVLLCVLLISLSITGVSVIIQSYLDLKIDWKSTFAFSVIVGILLMILFRLYD